MIERKGDLWAEFGHAGHRIAISTNGFRKKNGAAVMGRGCAYQATLMFKDIAHRLGEYIEKNGNVPGYLFVHGAVGGYQAQDRLMILPVKHRWYEQADLGLVTKSVAFLAKEALNFKDWTFHVPRLGCGNGRLDWTTQVRPLMASLPDSVWVHS